MNKIADRLDSAYSKITSAAKKSGRPASDITLLAVSKTKPIPLIVEAYEFGQRKFGENYVQEGVEKIHHFAQQNSFADIEWHFIGPLQSNKTKLVATHFDWVQSVDREKIATRLSEQRPNNSPKLNVLIQINANDEASKSGIQFNDVEALASTIAALPNLTLRGIMSIPIKTNDTMALNKTFTKLKDCFDKLKSQYDSVDTLSMGMTNDMDLAIEHGSTMVRLGTAIFGEREKSE
ncbi:YggS family pyridoxal phosphate-dependent enzyme [Flocculibacter collagenilyticus]|uniref:YggS family pyridoxal phosphate-dependent enzyme n=1 Tax=Flocculibacter collagenilyticus TaxID=2744479 RepID=UPI0018F2B183|nr:YggS family pyridoxal phosphate-dependent enzyme [Flocculibacter collagenilyticus]